MIRSIFSIIIGLHRLYDIEDEQHQIYQDEYREQVSGCKSDERFSNFRNISVLPT